MVILTPIVLMVVGIPGCIYIVLQYNFAMYNSQSPTSKSIMEPKKVEVLDVDLIFVTQKPGWWLNQPI